MFSPVRSEGVAEKCTQEACKAETKLVQEQQKQEDEPVDVSASAQGNSVKQKKKKKRKAPLTAESPGNRTRNCEEQFHQKCTIAVFA